jgi:dTDP-4-amino-4,6-dideoxygalactose transaminase
MSDPIKVVREFEEALCAYTGAKYAVTTTSCTSALLLALLWAKHCHGLQTVEIPRRTYVGVAMSIVNAGHKIAFRDEDWTGCYELRPLKIWDSARFFTKEMASDLDGDDSVCCSFHWRKTLSISQGGAILHNDKDADEWLRRARFDGRREGVLPRDDTFDMIGHHCYMAPSTAAEGLTRLAILPDRNMPIANDDYPDLSKFPVFEEYQ